MILIADSGSTKSDWVLLNGALKSNFETIGLNPFFHSEQDVVRVLEENTDLYALRDKISQVYFYGAGCSSEALNGIISSGLESVFSKASINVDHDLNACAYATYQGEPAISCIIGTGSNSCYYDGKEVSETIPALGYILGDEGSGSYFGKKLLASYLYNHLPQRIHDALQNEIKLTKDEIITNVYMRPNANVYLASFMKFIVQHHLDPFIQEMIFEGFKHFNGVHVCCYPNFKEVKVHYVGSIAYLFSEQLIKACDVYSIQLGTIIQKPIDGLIAYHEKLLAEQAGVIQF